MLHINYDDRVKKVFIMCFIIMVFVLKRALFPWSLIFVRCHHKSQHYIYYGTVAYLRVFPSLLLFIYVNVQLILIYIAF